MIALLALAFGAPVLGDPDGISVQPGLLLQTRISVDSLTDGAPTFAMQRVRPVLRGTIDGSKATWFVQTELAGTVSLLDAHVDLTPFDGFTVRAGRFLVPFSRAQTTPVPKLQYHGFSRSTDAMDHGRDIGLQVGLHPAESPIHGQLGVFQGGGELDRAHPLVVGHLDADVIGVTPWDETAAITDPDGAPAWSVGLGGIEGVQPHPDGTTELGLTVGLDTAARIGPVRAQAEAFWRRWKGGSTDLGGTAQASVRVAHPVELGARGDLLELDGARIWTVETLANVYLKGDHLRLGLVGTARVTEDGLSEAVALQEQLWF